MLRTLSTAGLGFFTGGLLALFSCALFFRQDLAGAGLVLPWICSVAGAVFGAVVGGVETILIAIRRLEEAQARLFSVPTPSQDAVRLPESRP